MIAEKLDLQFSEIFMMTKIKSLCEKQTHRPSLYSFCMGHLFVYTFQSQITFKNFSRNNCAPYDLAEFQEKYSNL